MVQFSVLQTFLDLYLNEKTLDFDLEQFRNSWVSELRERERERDRERERERESGCV
jgi:hypothetical protein